MSEGRRAPDRVVESVPVAPYPIHDVTPWESAVVEKLGTKEKEWLRAPDGRLWLFKLPRASTGDDWAEKAAAELAVLLELPHARVELAVRSGQRGSIGLNFTYEGDREVWKLALGNEHLFRLDASYPRDTKRGVRGHTVDRVLDLLEQRAVPPPSATPDPRMSSMDVFAGYLLLDAWIGNQDRHHENWGVLYRIDATEGPVRELAPSYDHAACLGQILTDEERTGRLGTRDRKYAIETWAAKARSALYLDEGSSKLLSTFAAFERAAARYPRGARFWLERLEAIPASKVGETLDALPESCITPAARRFASRLLDVNRQSLLRSSR